MPSIEFQVDPSAYRHWRVAIDGPVATVTMQVDPAGGLRDDYELKLNSYDLSVDIELYDIVQRLRFEHPEVGAVVVTGGLEKVFCAGANIQMLSSSTHDHKVNFCKFTNETRNSIEDATANSNQVWLAAVNGTAAGGGYELALACDEIILVDDRSSSVSLPEVALLAVLPGTGGLTRVVDKRHVRRDLADVFSTRSEGVKGSQAVEWGLVDIAVSRSSFESTVAERAAARAAASDRHGPVITLTPLVWSDDGDTRHYDHLDVSIDRQLGAAYLTVRGPIGPQPLTPHELSDAGATAWILAACRQLDHAILHLRFNETTVGTWVLQTDGNAAAVVAAEQLLHEYADDSAVREIRLFWARTLKRLDVSARTLVALVTEGSCFAGTLAELTLAADRSFMLDASDARLQLSDANDGWYPMPNGITRLQARFFGRNDRLDAARAVIGKELDASEAAAAQLITTTPDDIDWDDDVRLMLEERNSFSPDALTGLEANCRFVGPETMESKIFSRLSAWQNWIFSRPNAVGSDGALHRYGTGSRPTYDRKRV